MTDLFNPHAPCVLGLEWRPTIEFEGLVAGLDQNVAGFWLDATATETIDTLHVLVTERLFSSRGFTLEVYDPAALTAATLETVEFVPSLLFAESNMVAVGAGDIPTALSDDPSTWVAGSYSFPSGAVEAIPDTTFAKTNDGRPGSFGLQFDTVAGVVPATALVQSVELQFYGQTLKGTGPGQPASSVTPIMMRNGVRYTEADLYLGPNVVEATGKWTVDPATGQPWTVAAVELFDDTNPLEDTLGLLLTTYGSAEVFSIIGSARLVVTYVDPDPRLAIGTFDSSVLTPGWQPITMTLPDGTPGWPKVSGDSYLVLLRRYENNGRTLKVRALGYNAPDDRALAPQPLVGTTVEFAESHVPQSAAPVRTNAMAVVMVTGGVPSVDSQPYASADGDQEWVPFGNDPNCYWSQISANDPGEQDLTATAGGDYQYLRMIVRAAGNALPDGDLVVTVKDRADDSTVLGPLTLDPAVALAAPYDAWQLAEHVFDLPATVAPATQLYVELTSVAPATNGWHVQALSTLSELPATMQPPANTDDTTYGGVVDTARWRSTVLARDGVDYAIVLSTLPPALTGLAAVVSSTDCTDSVAVTWDAPAALDCGTVFGGYELERYADTAPEWVPVATIWDDATLTWTDLEAPRNTTVSYRIRQRRLDGAPSLWSDTADVVTTDGCCGYRISSNEAELTLWYDDLGIRVYRITDHTTFVEYEAQDFAAGFQELQQRPDVIDIDLMVAADGALDGTPAATAPGGRDVFAPALELMGAQRQTDGTLLVLSYLCVADETGHVWYGTLKPRDATREEPGGLYTLSVTLTQTSARPIPVEVGTAP